MNLQGHLLYLDITQICGIGCAFCMYADKHKSGQQMTLSSLAIENLEALINAPDVKRISVSGEGEPLNNVEAFHQILSLSRGARAFEFITSGFLPHEKLEAFYERTNAIAAGNGDRCNIRLSSDSHHIEKIKHRPHGFSAGYMRRRRPGALTLSFRSVDADREFTRSYLLNELGDWGLDPRIEPRGPLEDELVVDGETFSVDYKNLVHPAQYTPGEFLDLRQYVAAIEDRVRKPFTFGSLNKAPYANGLDVTVKPNGDVFLYGIENVPLGNFHKDRISWAYLIDRVRDSPLARALYTRPFLDLIQPLSGDEVTQSILAEVNNPYWVVKAMARHDGLLERLIAA